MAVRAISRRRLAAQQAHHKDHRAAQHRNGQALAKGRQAQLQRRAAVAGVKQRGHLAQLGVHAGGHHQPARAAMGGRGALEGHVGAVAQRAHVFGGQGFGLLGHGDGFAREGRLIHLQLRNLDEPQVGRDLVARLQQHDVAGHQLSGGHGPAPCPPRSTVACAAASWRSAAMAWSARQACTKPMTALSTTMTRITSVSVTSPTSPDITAAPSSTSTMKSLNWSASRRHQGRSCDAASSIGAMGGAAAQGLVGMQARVGVDTMGLGDGLGGVQVRRGGWGHAAIGKRAARPRKDLRVALVRDLRPGFVELERGFWHLVEHLAL